MSRSRRVLSRAIDHRGWRCARRRLRRAESASRRRPRALRRCLVAVVLLGTGDAQLAECGSGDPPHGAGVVSEHVAQRRDAGRVCERPERFGDALAHLGRSVAARGRKRGTSSGLPTMLNAAAAASTTWSLSSARSGRRMSAVELGSATLTARAAAARTRSSSESSSGARIGDGLGAALSPDRAHDEELVVISDGDRRCEPVYRPPAVQRAAPAQTRPSPHRATYLRRGSIRCTPATTDWRSPHNRPQTPTPRRRTRRQAKRPAAARRANSSLGGSSDATVIPAGWVGFRRRRGAPGALGSRQASNAPGQRFRRRRKPTHPAEATLRHAPGTRTARLVGGGPFAVPPEGIEPSTFGLRVRCSNQLS